MTREEALKHLDTILTVGEQVDALEMAIEALKERPHGEWKDKDYGIGRCWATCSECGESTNGEAQDNGFGYDYSFPKFCPYCGADMREGDPD